MRLLVPVLLALLGLAISGDRAFADGPWQGYWATTWQDGGAGLDLTQDGNRVTGTYPLHGGRVEAVATGSRLDGRWTEGNQSGGFVLFMGRDGNSFSGTYETGEWWTGARAAAFDEPTSIDFKNPREVFQQFVIHNNIARGGRPDHWGIAMLTLDFGDAGATMERADKLRRMQDLFSVIDLTTFRTSSVPANPPYPPVKLRLEQAGTDAAMTLTMVKDEFGDWRIHVPSDEEVDADRRAFLAARGGQPPTADGYKRLQNPRDTMRSFLVGMSDWDGDGRALALSTLDLSGMPEGLRKGQGPITALYLRHVLNRIGLVGLQSIPNDGTDRTPYPHFSHPAGRIVIAPSGPEPGAPWKFTQRAVADVDNLYREVDALPPQASVPTDLIPDSTFFVVRRFFRTYFPGSLGSLGQLEYWQLIVMAAAVVVAGLTGLIVSRVAQRGAAWLVGDDRMPSRLFVWSVAIAVGATIANYMPTLLGAPQEVRSYTYPIFGIVRIVAGSVAVWHLLNVVGLVLGRISDRTSAATDDILYTLLIAFARLSLIVLCFLGIAHFLSLPTNGILAGIGIGGLAFAFASRETLSNVFGAGILVSDRPFRRGDWIMSGDIQGSVEHSASAPPACGRLRTASWWCQMVSCPTQRSTISAHGASACSRHSCS